jgi:hypothetical protein
MRARLSPPASSSLFRISFNKKVQIKKVQLLLDIVVL